MVLHKVTQEKMGLHAQNMWISIRLYYLWILGVYIHQEIGVIGKKSYLPTHSFIILCSRSTYGKGIRLDQPSLDVIVFLTMLAVCFSASEPTFALFLKLLGWAAQVRGWCSYSWFRWRGHHSVVQVMSVCAWGPSMVWPPWAGPIAASQLSQRIFLLAWLWWSSVAWGLGRSSLALHRLSWETKFKSLIFLLVLGSLCVFL